MTDEKPLPSLEQLDKKLKAFHAATDQPSDEKQGKESSISPFRVGTELVSGVIAGILVGYFLDRLFGTKPVFFLICFVFGTIAGGLNIYRALTKNSNSQ